MQSTAGAGQGIGLGEILGRAVVNGLPEGAAFPFQDISILATAYKKRVPVTIHVAVGTDIIHAHPAASGKSIGEASHHDFRLFCTLVRELDGGGVYLNVGSAVLLPEVFLKGSLGSPQSGKPA